MKNADEKVRVKELAELINQTYTALGLKPSFNGKAPAIAILNDTPNVFIDGAIYAFPNQEENSAYGENLWLLSQIIHIDNEVDVKEIGIFSKAEAVVSILKELFSSRLKVALLDIEQIQSANEVFN